MTTVILASGAQFDIDVTQGNDIYIDVTGSAPDHRYKLSVREALDMSSAITTAVGRVTQRERTFAMIKSEAIASGASNSIINDFILPNFRMVKWKSVVMTRDEQMWLYSDHMNKPYAKDLLNSVDRGVMMMILEAPEAIRKWRDLMGATNAKVALPGSIRHKFGSHIIMADNAVHGSDGAASAAKEINFFFPELVA